MARFNEILSGRLNRALQKFTGIKAAAPTPQLATEFMPVFPFFWGCENRYLESWFRYANAVQTAAVAAQVCICNIRNPINSGVVVVWEKINWTNLNAAAQTLTIAQGPQPIAGQQDLGTPITNNTRFDNRGQNNSMLVITTGTAGGVLAGWGQGNQWGLFGLAVNAEYDLVGTDIQEFTLLPGDGIRLASTTVNSQHNANFMWRERALEDSEKF